MEKHTMQDGPIPLFGSLPSAVSRQWGGATGSKTAAYASSQFHVTLPINYQKQIAQVLVSICDGGTDNSWESTTAWAQNATLKSFVAGIVAEHPFTIPPKISWVALGK